MRVFITGATGFVGRALVQKLQAAGVGVTAFVRDPERARSQLGPNVTLCPTACDETTLATALSHSTAVINLAGENVLGGRWTKRRKQSLWASRVDLTERLVRGMQRANPRPQTLVSASAVGFYGQRGAEPIDEQAAAGQGFLADLCQAWEAAAGQAEFLGVRVVQLRIGLVLGEAGGMFGAVLPIFSAGLGGPLGPARHFLPWIALEDLVDSCLFALQAKELSGPVNATAPTPVTAAQFAATFAQELNRPARLPAPAWLLRLLLGQRAQVLIQGQRALPSRLLAAGFRFKYRKLRPLLTALLANRRQVHITLNPEAAREPGAETGPRARAHYLLHARTEIPVAAAEAFEFFAHAENLGFITPPFMGFQITHQRPATMGEATEIGYRIRLGPTQMRWQTRIPVWDPPRRFVDNQERGPYTIWWHEHAIEPTGPTSCVMNDRVYYSPPLGLLGRIAHRLFIRRTLTTIFAYRQSCISRLYSGTSSNQQQPVAQAQLHAAP